MFYKKNQKANTEALLEIFAEDIEALKEEANSQINDANEMMAEVFENIKEQHQFELTK